MPVETRNDHKGPVKLKEWVKMALLHLTSKLFQFTGFKLVWVVLSFICQQIFQNDLLARAK